MKKDNHFLSKERGRGGERKREREREREKIIKKNK
jgi:hypothetical protein